MHLTPMQYFNSALGNAYASGLTLEDVQAMAEHADTPEAFDHAVNMLAEAMPKAVEVME